MGGTAPSQPAPGLADLLSTLTWEQLRPIAERHGIPVAGRRREPLVERLRAALLDPAHLAATIAVLETGARSLLGILLLRGGAGRSSDIESWRQRLRAARPDLDPALAALRPAQDSVILAGLGLCFRRHDGARRGAYQLVVPAELVDRLPLLLPAARAAGPGAPPQTFSRVYADLARRLAALSAHAANEPGAALWFDILRLAGLLGGSPARPTIDQARVARFVAPDTFCQQFRDTWLALDQPSELNLLRSHVWRAVERLGVGRWDVESLAATLEALDLLPPPAPGADTAAANPPLFDRVLAEMHTLGLVERVNDMLALAAAFVPDAEPGDPRVILADDSLTVVHPERLPPVSFRALEGLGGVELVADGALRWPVTPAAIARLGKSGGDSAQLLAAIAPYTPVPDEWARRLTEWESAAVVVELHYPLPVLLARDAAALEHILRAADLESSTTPLGDRAVIVAPAEADSVFERLHKRGFWPRRGQNESSGTT